MTAGDAILGVSWATLIIGAIVVALRLYTRASRKALSWDDYTITAAMVRHIDSLTPTQFSANVVLTGIA